MKRWYLVCLLTIVFFAQLVQAQSLSETSRSLRALGMGGVYIPFVTGADAVFYNPAALGRVSGLDIKLASVAVGGGSTSDLTQETLNELQNIDPNDPSTFNNLFGKRIWLQGTGKVAFALPYFGMGYLTDYETSLELHNPAYPEFDTYFRNDTAIYLGGAVPLGPVSYLGMSLKRINRWGGNSQQLSLTEVSNATSIDDIGRNFDRKGQGYGLDLAVMTEIPLPLLKPTFALVWQDAGSTSFTKTSGTEAPPHIEQNLSFGAGVALDLPGLDVAVGGELRHLLEPDIQAGKKLHLGAEVSLPVLDLRAGYGQGYLSYGVGLNFLIFHIDAVSYTEELGVYPGQTAENRVMVGLSIDLGFDADFKFTDNNGKKRKVKQRR